MSVKISGDVLQDIGYQADLDDMITDGNRYFKGGTNRPFPAWEAEGDTDVAKFIVELGIRAGNPEIDDVDEKQAYEIAERLMTESLGRGIVFGFPGVELT